MKEAYLYILTNKTNNLLYIGVSGNIKARLFQHRKHLVEGLLINITLQKLFT